jgi:hypothetical protein
MMGFKVCKERCNECLFSPDKIVSNRRKQNIIRECIRENKFFVCHKHGVGTEEGTEGEEVCCRGFYDSYGPQINIIRIAQRLNAIKEVETIVEVL